MLLCLLFLDKPVVVLMFNSLYVFCLFIFFFFFKQKTAYEMRISDWSSDVCSSDLRERWLVRHRGHRYDRSLRLSPADRPRERRDQVRGRMDQLDRSEEHTSELQSLMRISYAVFCLKKKNPNIQFIN